MKKLFRRLAYIALFAIVLSPLNPVKACHLAAADINVTYVGPGIDGCTGTPVYEYEVELTVYFACQTCQGTGPQNTTVSYGSASAQAEGLPNPTGSIPMSDVRALADTVHQLCAQFEDSNSCKTNLATASRFPAFKVRRYRGNVTLPYARTDWRFWYSLSARSVSNITPAGCGALYVEAGLDNATKYNNSTPKFQSNPLPYICVNQPTTYLNDPYDVNGDSVNVEIQRPYTNQTNQCNYTAPSTAANPIESTSGYTLNKATGSLEFTPGNAGLFVLAFRAEDYLPGTNTRLSYVYRDVQVSVLPCTEPPPAIDTLSEQFTSITNGAVIKTKNKGDAIFVCPGSNLSLDLNSKAIDPTHNVYMSATSTIPAGSYSFTTANQGSSNVTGTFQWTPTTNDIGEYRLTVLSKDSTCLATQPIVLISRRVFIIKVLEGIDAGPDIPVCELNPQEVKLYVKGADDLDLKWTLNGGPATGLSNDTIHNPTALVSEKTTYTVTAPQLQGTCKKQDDVILYLDTSNKVTVTPRNPRQPEEALVMCNPGYLQLEAITSGRPPKNNVPCGTGSPTLCSTQDTNTVYGSFVFGEKTYDTTGDMTPIMFNTLKTNKFQYLIRKDEMDDAKIFSATIRGLGFETIGTTTPTYQYTNFRIAIKCTEKTELKKDDGFEDVGMTEVYYSPAVTFEDGQHFYPFTVPYNWDTSKNIIVQICYSDNPVVDTGCGVTSAPPIVKFAPTTYTSGLTVKAQDVVEQNVCGITKSNRIEERLARPTFTFTYCEASPLNFEVVWKEGPHISDSNIFQPLAYVPGSTRYVVQTLGRSGCLMRDTLEVYVPDHDFSISPEDTAICFGEETPIQGLGNGWRYWWYEYDNGQYIKDGEGVSCFECPTPTIKPSKTTDYRIVVSDSVFCYDTLNARIEILPLPDVRILTEDTTVKYGKPFQILASGARLYNWTPVSSLNNPNISYPIAQPTEDTRYVLGGISANGCRAFDTLYVTIDDRDNLFVPSAFSPNGDGKNDMFKITNLTFQKVMEFRVFNRWGQEIFSTTDNSRGWDGTWKGVDQNIGTYSYLIRVGYPDGLVETYRGDVSLIR